MLQDAIGLAVKDAHLGIANDPAIILGRDARSTGHDKLIAVCERTHGANHATQVVGNFLSAAACQQGYDGLVGKSVFLDEMGKI